MFKESKDIFWDDIFMTMVYLFAMKSKDANTHIGSVIVGPDNEVRSMGLNGFPRGIDDTVLQRQQKPEKYFWFAHAERNAIYNSARIGLTTKGCKMYTNGIPCADCAIAVIQSGIVEVIVDTKWNSDNGEKWDDLAKISLEMFKEAGIKVRYWNEELVDIFKYRRGNSFKS